MEEGDENGIGSRSESEKVKGKGTKLILTPKEVQVQEEDWRGVLALTFTLGTMAVGLLELLLTGATVLFERLLPMDAMIVAYYFGAKSKE
ncbi:MAG: hypothetical protein QXO94_03615 [Candidatus Bathyarchaeia archaeon]